MNDFVRRLCVLIIVLGMPQVFAGDYNLTDGTYQDVIYHADSAAGFINNEMSIQGYIEVDGDFIISNTQPMDDETDFFPIYIDASTVIFPVTSGTNNYGHVLFYTASCCQTVVYVDNDLSFEGNNGFVQVPRELTLTFSGPGQVVFHIADGKTVQFDKHANSDDLNTGYGAGVHTFITMDQTYSQAIENGQNKVVFERYYTFTDSLVDPTTSGTTDSVVIGIARGSFITFISPNETGLLDTDDPDSVGYGSIAFDPSCYGPGRMFLHLQGSRIFTEAGETHGPENAFNDGALVVAGHYVEDPYTMDGIRTTTDLTKPAGVCAILRIIDERAWADTNDYYAYDDVYDDRHLNVDGTTGEPILVGGDNDGLPSRRGLLVFNECMNVPSFAADPYVNNHWADGHVYFNEGKGTSAIRPGFIIGVNGMMELFHNTFLDYVVGSTSRMNPYEEFMENGNITTTLRKKRTPSALMIDGLSTFDIDNWEYSDPYNFQNSLHYPFEAHLKENGGRHAQILLRGDSRLYLRPGVRNDGITRSGIFIRGDAEIEEGDRRGGYLIGMTRHYSFTINADEGEGTYDGSFITGYADDGSLLYENPGEGLHVLDVEGKLTIRSTSDKNSTDDEGFIIHKSNEQAALGTYCEPLSRHAVTGVAPRGAITMPPIKIDYMGREIKNDDLELVERPLAVDETYLCYNSSSVFVNAEMELHNVHWHHSDLLKLAIPEQDDGEPTIVGGEKPSYDDYYWDRLYDNDYTETADTLFVENPLEFINTKVPLVSLYTSTLFLHESLVASGVRFVVTDHFEYQPGIENGHPVLVPNESHLICFNHGDSLDMQQRSYGRAFALGTQQSFLGDLDTNETLTTEFTENAYLSIYRTWNTDGNNPLWGDEGYLVRLSMETDLQPRYIMQYETRDTHPTGANAFSRIIEWDVDRQKRAATQVVFLGNDSFASLGWTTTNADQVISLDDMRDKDFATDGSYSYSFGINEGLRPRPWDAPWEYSDRYDVADTCKSSPLTQDDFRFSLSSDANDRVELYINGDHFYFGGKDGAGNIPTEPVSGATRAGVFYTNHGGKTYINQETIGIDQQRYYDCFVNTIFAYRPWPRIREDKTNPTSPFIDGLSGIVDLPHDQAKFGGSIQPYALDFQVMLLNDDQLKDENVRLSVYDDRTYGTTPVQRKKASGEIVVVAWNFRTDKSVRIDTTEQSPMYTPMKSPSGNKNFGLFKDGDNVIICPGDAFRLTCYSAEPCEIRIPAGGELDMSMLGEDVGIPKQIEFTGKIRLVFEPGATIKFPNDIDQEPILCVSGDSELVFEDEACLASCSGAGHIWFKDTKLR